MTHEAAPPPGHAATIDDTVDEVLRREEIKGFRLAAMGRLAVLVVLAGYFLTHMSPPMVWYPLCLVVGFSLHSVFMLFFCRLNFFQSWGKYIVVVMDIFLLTIAVLYPNPFLDETWPRTMTFRLHDFVFFSLMIGSVALTYTPGLVLVAGVTTAVCWLGATLIILSWPGTLTWADLDVTGLIGPADTITHFLQPAFVDWGGRVKEALSAVLLAVLLSIAVWRARRVVYRHAEADRARQIAEEAFGRFIPHVVARSIVQARRLPSPERREATVLFCDIADFTALCEALPAETVVGVLNAYFDAAGAVVTRHMGTITQIQGDALLAVFNLPVSDPDYVTNALAAAQALADLVATERFSGETIRVRIGVATGEVVAGGIGGRARLSYTVHGDAVNLAARLESLNKTYGSTVLVCERTATLANRKIALHLHDTVSIRGKQHPVAVYRPASSAADSRPSGLPAADVSTLSAVVAV